MAVIDEVPGLEVQIVVNGTPLREHRDRDAKISAKTAERYVEAQSSAEYEIHYSFKDPFPGDRTVSLIVTVDGKDLDEPIIRPFELFDPKGHASQGPRSSDGSRSMVQKYSFSKIDIREITAEKITDEMKEKLKPVGIITCEFYFVINARLNPYMRAPPKDTEELPAINEKAIKGDALSHHTVLSDMVPAEEVEYFDADYADGGEPFATFHFYYRSLEALKDLQIIERTPEPLDILDSDDSVLGQLNREQLEAIVRRFREKEETRIRTKRERSDSATVVGDEDDVGDRCQYSDPDILEMRWVNLREQRKRMRVPVLPSIETEVIELDD